MKTAPRQEYRDLEKLAFLCRWTLLTLAGAVPVYRKQDGVPMARNFDTLKRCREALARGGRLRKQGAEPAQIYAAFFEALKALGYAE